MADKIAISVKNVSKNFKLPHEKPSGLKQAIIKFRPGKRYEVQHVLENISFDIRAGEFFGIVGRNGSGKSTLLKLLAQIYTPNKGSVTINGSLTPFIELGVGFNAELTGRENVYLNGALLGFNRKQVDLIYDDIVEFAEIERFMDQKLKNYSSGMQVRLAFSIAIRAKSDILLIDEVLAVGDAAFQQKCFDYFGKLKAEKRTVILVSHDMASVKKFCTRAVHLESGKIVDINTPNVIAQQYLDSNFNANDSQSGPGDVPQMPVAISIDLESPSSFSCGDKIRAKVRVESTEDFDGVVGISVLQNLNYLGGFNSTKNEELLHITKGENQFIFEIESGSLSAGYYNLGCAVFEHSSFKQMGYTVDGPKLNVKNETSYKDGAFKFFKTDVSLENYHCCASNSELISDSLIY